MNKRLHSMKLQFVLVLLVAGIASVLVYLSLNTGIQRFLDTYFQRTDFVTEAERKTARSLQDFVSKKHTLIDDTAAIDQWVKRKKMVYITIFKDDVIVYDTIQAYGEYYDGQLYYNIEFQDGTAKVYFISFYGYNFYMMSMLLSMIIAVALFLIVCIGFMERKITYITLLEREIKILKNGSLEKEISIKGVDELSSLAEGLNEMRLSLKENMEMKEKLRSANKSLVTGLSHDLRTPLTTLMIYLELLENGKAPDAEKHKQYLKKCSEKAVQIKVLSDQLFESVLVSEKNGIDLETPQTLQYVFEDVISDMVMFLESQGFLTDCCIEWKPVKISVSIDYIIRIANNISSNLIKYADLGKPIEIEIQYSKKLVEVRFINGISPNRNEAESTKMGVDNVRSMMQKMGGSCKVEEYEGCYDIRIRFPISND